MLILVSEALFSQDWTIDLRIPEVDQERFPGDSFFPRRPPLGGSTRGLDGARVDTFLVGWETAPDLQTTPSKLKQFFWPHHLSAGSQGMSWSHPFPTIHPVICSRSPKPVYASVPNPRTRTSLGRA